MSTPFDSPQAIIDQLQVIEADGPTPQQLLTAIYNSYAQQVTEFSELEIGLRADILPDKAESAIDFLNEQFESSGQTLRPFLNNLLSAAGPDWAAAVEALDAQQLDPQQYADQQYVDQAQAAYPVDAELARVLVPAQVAGLSGQETVQYYEVIGDQATGKWFADPEGLQEVLKETTTASNSDTPQTAETAPNPESAHPAETATEAAPAPLTAEELGQVTEHISEKLEEALTSIPVDNIPPDEIAQVMNELVNELMDEQLK